MKVKILLFSVFVLFVIVGSASANQVIVGSCAGATATTIQAGIKQVSSGGTVLVCPGTYTGGILVNKSGITIKPSGAQGSAKIVGSVSAGPLYGFDVVANNVHILNFDISGFLVSPDAAGIFVGGHRIGDDDNRASGAVIQYNIIHGNVDGIVLWQTNGNVVQNNEIYGSTDLDGAGGIAIKMIAGRNDTETTDANTWGRSGKSNNISTNYLHDNDRVAVYVASFATSVMANAMGTVVGQNQIYNNGADTGNGGSYPSEAVSIQYAQNATASSNNIYNNAVAGGLLNYTYNMSFQQNTEQNTSPSATCQAGFLIFSSNGLNFAYNTTDYNLLYGIYVTSSTNGVFDNNTSLGNGSYDFGWDQSGTFNFFSNTCDTATPTKAAWGCP